MEALKKFLEALRTDPRAAELLEGKKKPGSIEEIAEVYAEIAQKIGFDLKEEDIREGIKTLEEEQKAKTKQAKEAAQKLSSNDLDKVVGGVMECPNPSNPDPCSSTYRDEENCRSNDGYDKAATKYDNYDYKCTNMWD